MVQRFGMNIESWIRQIAHYPRWHDHTRVEAEQLKVRGYSAVSPRGLFDYSHATPRAPSWRIAAPLIRTGIPLGWCRAFDRAALH